MLREAANLMLHEVLGRHLTHQGGEKRKRGDDVEMGPDDEPEAVDDERSQSRVFSNGKRTMQQGEH